MSRHQSRLVEPSVSQSLTLTIESFLCRSREKLILGADTEPWEKDLFSNLVHGLQTHGTLSPSDSASLSLWIKRSG